MILEKLTIIDTFKQWRDKINAIIDEYEGVPSTDMVEGTLTIDTDHTQATSFIVDIPSTYKDTVLFTDNVTIEGDLNAIASSANKLQNPIQLNGSLFDGSEDTITSNWGTSRAITVSDHSGKHEGVLKYVNGSEDYVFKMPEIFNGYLEGDAQYAVNLKTMRYIDGVGFDAGADVTHYAVCSSDAGEQIKSVEVPNFNLTVGATVTVKFAYTNTAGSPELNVNDTGAKPIYLRNKNIETNALLSYATYTFVYDGNNYNVVTSIDTTVAQNISALNVDYPLLASPILNGVSEVTSSLFAPNVVLNPSKNSISASKFIANINNDSPQSFFVAKNTSESFTNVPVVDTYVRYASYEDGSNHMLGAFEYQKNADGSRYSNIVIPKFNANGEEIAHSVLQVGWNASNKEQVNCNGSLDVKANITVGGELHAPKIYGMLSNDYAEFFEKGEETEAGDIIALDVSSNEERYVKATDTSKLIVGIHSDSYGHILGGENSIEESEKTHIPVGLSGRVFVKFKGKSILGEAVVPSDTPGVGRLYDEFLDDKRKIVGYIVHDPEPTTKDVRKVRVLINR